MKRILAVLLLVLLFLSILVGCGSYTESTEDLSTEDITTVSSTNKSNSSSSYKSFSSGSSSSFTNKYGTSTTKCAHAGCNNYIASSGDTNCCTTHSNKCLECGCYIDEDAMFCLSCITKAANS